MVGMGHLKAKLLVLLAGSLGLSGISCAADDARRDQTPVARDAAVSLKSIAFQPSKIEVSAGRSVVWTNRDVGVAHTVTSGTPGAEGIPGATPDEPARRTGLFDSGMLESGASFEFEFEEVGRHRYFCEIHPSMTALVIVTH